MSKSSPKQEISISIDASLLQEIDLVTDNRSTAVEEGLQLWKQKQKLIRGRADNGDIGNLLSQSTTELENERAVKRVIDKAVGCLSTSDNIGAIRLLNFLNEQVLREQDIFWQRFSSFATLHAGAFVLYSSDAPSSKYTVALAGFILSILWIYIQWASLEYADRAKTLYHPLREYLGIDWNIPRKSLFAQTMGKYRWASSTNAGVLTAWIIFALWLFILLHGMYLALFV